VPVRKTHPAESIVPERRYCAVKSRNKWCGAPTRCWMLYEYAGYYTNVFWTEANSTGQHYEQQLKDWWRHR